MSITEFFVCCMLRAIHCVCIPTCINFSVQNICEISTRVMKDSNSFANIFHKQGGYNSAPFSDQFYCVQLVCSGRISNKSKICETATLLHNRLVLVNFWRSMLVLTRVSGNERYGFWIKLFC